MLGHAIVTHPPNASTGVSLPLNLNPALCSVFDTTMKKRVLTKREKCQKCHGRANTALCNCPDEYSCRNAPQRYDNARRVGSVGSVSIA